MARIELLAKQIEFLQSTDRLAAYTGSIASGKTFILSVWALGRASHGRKVILLEPTYVGVQDVLIPTLQEVAEILGQKLDIRRTNPPDAFINGGQILMRTADRPDGLRGINAHDLGMDECSYMKDDSAYKVAIGRLRKAEDAQIRIVGSPRGRDWVYKLTRDCKVFRQSIYENHFLPKAYIADLEAQYTGEFARQELFGEIVDFDGPSVMIPRSLVVEAQKRIPMDTGDSLVAGLDVARFGDDRSVLMVRKGNQLLEVHKWQGLDLMSLSTKAAEIIMDKGILSVVVDGVGVGAGVVDSLRGSVGEVCSVIEFNGGYKANDGHYYNARAEAWGRMKEWLQEAQIPENEDLEEDLTSVEYFFNTAGKLQLESKEQIKRRGLPSPDLGDALSMTFFAEPMVKKPRVRRQIAWQG